MNKNQEKKLMMRTAVLFAEQSYARRKKVGAVLVKDGRIIASGYNGTIPGHANVCEHFTLFTDRDLLDNETVIDCPDCSNYSFTCLTCDGKTKIIVQDKTNDFTIHAEQNVLMYCTKNGISTDECEIYITMSPCKQCAKLMVQAGIKKVYFLEQYKDTSGIDFLLECGIMSEQIILD